MTGLTWLTVIPPQSTQSRQRRPLEAAIRFGWLSIPGTNSRRLKSNLLLIDSSACSRRTSRRQSHDLQQFFPVTDDYLIHSFNSDTCISQYLNWIRLRMGMLINAHRFSTKTELNIYELNSSRLRLQLSCCFVVSFSWNWQPTTLAKSYETPWRVAGSVCLRLSEARFYQRLQSKWIAAVSKQLLFTLYHSMNWHFLYLSLFWCGLQVPWSYCGEFILKTMIKYDANATRKSTSQALSQSRGCRSDWYHERGHINSESEFGARPWFITLSSRLVSRVRG